MRSAVFAGLEFTSTVSSRREAKYGLLSLIFQDDRIEPSDLARQSFQCAFLSRAPRTPGRHTFGAIRPASSRYGRKCTSSYSPERCAISTRFPSRARKFFTHCRRLFTANVVERGAHAIIERPFGSGAEIPRSVAVAGRFIVTAIVELGTGAQPRKQRNQAFPKSIFGGNLQEVADFRLFRSRSLIGNDRFGITAPEEFIRAGKTCRDFELPGHWPGRPY